MPIKIESESSSGESVNAIVRDRLVKLFPVGCECQVYRDDQFRLGLHLFPAKGRKTELINSLNQVLASAIALLPLATVRVDDDAPLPVAEVLQLWPAEARLPCCEALEQEHLGLLAGIAKAAISELCTLNRSVFLINSEGIYVRAELSDLADPPCVAEEMLGRRIKDVMGTEAHDEIVRQIKNALSLRQECGAFYQAPVEGEIRTYAARIRPLVGDVAWVLVIRLD